MMKNLIISFLIFQCFGMILFAQDKDSLLKIEKSKLANINPYDDKANPTKELANAIKSIKLTDKRILLQVGGNWCIWCKRLEKMFIDNLELDSLLKDSFILVKVNYSKENKNEEFLKNYPKVSGYPHIYVLENDGSLLQSQDTAVLEQGNGYEIGKIKDFLNKWRKSKD